MVQAILTFAMSYFKLLVGLCKDIEVMIQKFWWGQHGDCRKVHWKNLDTLCKKNVERGLGLKDLSKFNDVMLVKQVWQLIYDEESLEK